MTIASNYPAIKPSLLLDFANTERLDPRITFTRTTTATYYDGVTTAKAEENLLLYSQEFNNAVWTNINTTETSGATAPDGTATAFTLNDGVATSGHDISEGFSGTSGVTYTLSAFFKNVSRQYVILACSAGTNTWASAKFDLTAGTAGSTSAAGSGWSTTSSSITSVGNSWYRCTITFVSGSTAGLTARLGMATDGTTFTAGQRGLESYTGTNATVEIWGAQLEQRSAVTAYTPTTTQAITNYIPVLKTAAAGVARFDHNPTTGESLGLLVEEQRTNLLLYSQEFDNVYWTKAASSITSNTIVAPDGMLTGCKLVEDTANASHNINRSIGVTTGAGYALTVYAKKGERSFFRLQSFNATGDAESAIFDLNAGTIVSGTTGSTITPVGNGWYRCYVPVVNDTDTSSVMSIQLYSDGTTSSYTGNGYSGIYIWGAQLEAGAFPTSYIATTSATVTRNADEASMTGTNFSSWFNLSKGTIYAEFVWEGLKTVSGQVIINFDDGTVNNRIAQITDASNGLLNRVIIGGSADGNNTTPATTYLAGSAYKNAFAFQVNDVVTALNGSIGTVDTSMSTMPSGLSNLKLGASTTATSNMWIRKLAYYPLRVTNAQLQALTS